MTEQLSPDDVLLALVGYGSAWHEGFPEFSLSDARLNELLISAGDHRMIGALAEAAMSGVLALSAGQLDRLTEHHTDWLDHTLKVERMLVQVADAFDAAGVRFRVLKGVALSRLVYDDPSWRVFSDLDLLIRSADFDNAVRVAIEDLGGVQPIPELRPGFDREFGDQALVAIGRLELDLHRTFVVGPFGQTIDLDGLMEDSIPLNVGGQQVLALGADAQFLHACYNITLGDYPVRLCSVRDLLLCAEHLDLDRERVSSLMRHWHATAVVHRAAELASDTVELHPDDWLWQLARLPVPKRERLLLHSYLTTARSYTRPLASLAVIPGVKARLRYAHAVVVPSREYLRSRGWTERGHLRRAIDRLRRRDDG